MCDISIIEIRSIWYEEWVILYNTLKISTPIAEVAL